MYNETITQRLALGNGVPPQVLNNAILNSDGVDLQKSKRAFFILSIGAVTGGGSISAWLQESADNSTWTANDTAGSFTVTATTAGVSKPATFHLTNTSVGRARVTCTTALPG